MSVCLSVWAVPRRFFQSLPVPCGASPDVTNSREKRNQGQSDFLRQKIWQTRKKNLGLGQPRIIFFIYFCIDQDYLFFFQLLSVPIKGMDEKSVRLDDGTDLGEDQKKIFRLQTTQNQFYFFCIDQDYLFFLLANVRPN